MSTLSEWLRSEDVLTTTAEALKTALGPNNYDCIRVWEAWWVRTMGADDFIQTVDDMERVQEIAGAALIALADSVKEDVDLVEWIETADATQAIKAGLSDGLGDSNYDCEIYFYDSFDGMQPDHFEQTVENEPRLKALVQALQTSLTEQLTAQNTAACEM